MYIKTSNPALFLGMIQKQRNWILCKEKSNIDEIKKHNLKFPTKKIKESISKSYKFIGKATDLNIDIIRFNSDAYKEVAHKSNFTILMIIEVKKTQFKMKYTK